MRRNWKDSDAIELASVRPVQKNPHCQRSAKASQEIHPLEQYGPFAFIPYLQTATSTTTITSSSSSSSSSQTVTPQCTLLNTSTWTYCGPLLSSSPDLPPSFHPWANATISSPPALLDRLLPLLSFLKKFLEDAGVQNYWLTIRVTQKNTEFDVPRWHVDEDFFGDGFNGSQGMGMRRDGDDESTSSQTDWQDIQAGRRKGKGRRRDQERPGEEKEEVKGTFREPKKRRWKLATTLLGPSTLFLPHNIQDKARSTLHQTRKSALEALDMTSHTCPSLNCLACSTFTSLTRCRLASSFRTLPTVSPSLGEIGFFRIGSDEGAVHSEPSCAGGDRVFVNVVPGTECELRGLLGRWGMGWPRDWSFGVPVGFEYGVVGEKKDMDERKRRSLSDVLDKGVLASDSSSEEQGSPLSDVSRSALELNEASRRSLLESNQLECIINTTELDNTDNKEPRQNNTRRTPNPRFRLKLQHTAQHAAATSTMTANLSQDYTAWLSGKGVSMAKVFGSRAEPDDHL